MIGPDYYTNSERFAVYLDELDPESDSFSVSLSPFIPSVKGKCVVANGCFDGLHPGHLSLLGSLDTIAYRNGLRPIVAINSDSSIRRLKGTDRPLYTERVRAQLLNHLKWPFTVVIFDQDTPQRLMDLLQPVLVVKGADYNKESVVKWKDSEVVLVDLTREYVGGPFWSTTRLRGDTR
jgi:rfaE bifunctional protein nucleotidyltransferase chain/domain